ncbi:MAG TPA: hypothetical protein VE969_06445 [Pyrinomonadaceae bacterium]|nr:hypothetical protein [Pyrinomonadaceae bacterium]
MPLTKRLLIAFPLSILITLALLIAYALFPIVAAMLKAMSRGPDSAGVAAVAGGVRSTSLLIVEPIVFVMVFLLLSRNNAK